MKSRSPWLQTAAVRARAFIKISQVRQSWSHKQSALAQDPAKYSCRCFLQLMLISKNHAELLKR